jgi:putative DNA primase/helicase
LPSSGDHRRPAGTSSRPTTTATRTAPCCSRWCATRRRPSASAVRTAAAAGAGGSAASAGCPTRLPELLGAAGDAPVFVVEGEKDADRLASLGLVATCNAGGANTWPDALNAPFRGRTVYILPDNDAAGRSHAQKVAAALKGVAVSARIVPLPDLPPGGDVSNWLDKGGDHAELLQLCQLPPNGQSDGDSQPDDPVLLPYCEEAITLVFSERNVDHLRYCEAFGKWFEWDEGRWREDGKRRVFSHARKLCRDKSAEALADIEHERAAMRISSTVATARTVAAVVNLARADARHATLPEDWDADPWALNTPVGIVDLRTGKTGLHDRRALARRSLPSRPLKLIVRAGGASSTRSPPAMSRSRRSSGGSRATA